MFRKKENNNNIDYGNLNDTIVLGKKILKIAYILVIILGIFVATKLFQEWEIKKLIYTFLSILSPLFIGIIIAWLFDPVVSYLQRKGLKRGLGTIILYAIIIGILWLVLYSLIPLLITQVNDFAKSLPGIVNTVKDWIDELFDKINIPGVDSQNIKANIFNNINKFGSNLTNELPTSIMNIVKSIISGTGTFIVGLIIGFFLLVSFNNANELFITLFPKSIKDDARDLTNEVNTSLRRFVRGAFLDCLLIFVVSSIGFVICGLKAPLLFGLFCGITNIIPYAGPYIGGAPAVIVAFSQSTPTGIFVLITIFVIQFLEGNFLQPIIMSKTTRLHPVTIIIGLLIFGHFFGIIGMAISTPVIAAIKSIILFFNDKYEFLKFN
ncbi:MAG: AI-2E family transporter [Bacilli bacterium]|nr:AI-2E family transporter [Bacilli bacterium]